VPAEFARLDTTRFALTPDEPPNSAQSQIIQFGDFLTGMTDVNCRNDAFAKIVRVRFSHPWLAPFPVGILNPIRGAMGIPDSIFPGNALVASSDARIHCTLPWWTKSSREIQRPAVRAGQGNTRGGPYAMPRTARRALALLPSRRRVNCRARSTDDQEDDIPRLSSGSISNWPSANRERPAWIGQLSMKNREGGLRAKASRPSDRCWRERNFSWVFWLYGMYFTLQRLANQAFLRPVGYCGPIRMQWST